MIKFLGNTDMTIQQVKGPMIWQSQPVKYEIKLVKNEPGLSF